MIDFKYQPKRCGKTIQQLMLTIIRGQDELKIKGYFRYVALLSRSTNIEIYCGALDYFVENKFIDSYRRKQIKGKTAWYIEVYKQNN